MTTEQKAPTLNTIDGITKTIEALLTSPGKGDKPSPTMLAVFGAVLDQIDKRGGSNSQIASTTKKVRESLGIAKPGVLNAPGA